MKDKNFALRLVDKLCGGKLTFRWKKHYHDKKNIPIDISQWIGIRISICKCDKYNLPVMQIPLPIKKIDKSRRLSG